MKELLSLRILLATVVLLLFSCLYVVTPRVMDTELYLLGFPFQWLQIFRQLFPLAPPTGGPWRLTLLPKALISDFAVYYCILLLISRTVSILRKRAA